MSNFGGGIFEKKDSSYLWKLFYVIIAVLDGNAEHLFNEI